MLPRCSATGASRINLSSGMRPDSFQPDTEGGLMLQRAATANAAEGVDEVEVGHHGPMLGLAMNVVNSYSFDSCG